MFFFSFEGIIIFRLVGYLFWSILLWTVSYKFLDKFNISFFKIFQPLIELVILILIIQFIISPLIFLFDYSMLYNLILNISNWLLPSNLDISEQINIIIDNGLLIITFIIIYILYLIIFKRLTKQDVRRIQNLNFRIPFKERIFPILLKILRSENSNN